MRDGLDKKCLQVLAQLIEQRLGWGAIQDWTQKDFQALSDQISSQVNDYVSVTTLKRAFGRVNYEGLPQQGTLNALAKYIGYTNWSSFRQHCVSIGLREDDAPAPSQAFPPYPPAAYPPTAPPAYYPPAGNSMPLGGPGMPFQGQPQQYDPGQSRPLYQANPQPVYYPQGSSVPLAQRHGSQPPVTSKPAVQLNVGPAPSIEQLMPDLLPKELPSEPKAPAATAPQQPAAPEVKTVKSHLGIKAEPEPIPVMSSTSPTAPAAPIAPTVGGQAAAQEVTKPEPVAVPTMVQQQPAPDHTAQQLGGVSTTTPVQAPSPKVSSKSPKPKDSSMGSLEPMLSRALTPTSLTPELDGENFNYEFWITSRKPDAKAATAPAQDSGTQPKTAAQGTPQSAPASTPKPQAAKPAAHDGGAAKPTAKPDFEPQRSSSSGYSGSASSTSASSWSAPKAAPQQAQASAPPAPFKIPRHVQWLVVGIIIGIMIGIMLGMNVTYPGRM